MKKELKIKVNVTGLNKPEVMEKFYDNLAKFWSTQIHKRINKLDITYEEKERLLDGVLENIKKT